MLTDDYIRPLGAAKEIQHLVLKGNEKITGAALVMLPDDIGLQTLDVAITGIGDKDVGDLLRFPKLFRVWGHAGQFSAVALHLALARRPDVEFKLIY